MKLFYELNEILRIGIQTAALGPNEDYILNYCLVEGYADEVFIHFGDLAIQKRARSAVGQELLDRVQLRRIKQNLRVNADFGKGALDNYVLIAVRFEQNNMLARQFFERNSVLRRQRVAFAYAKYQFGRHEGKDVVAVGNEIVKNRYAQINRIGIDQLTRLQAARLQHLEFNVGVQFGVSVEHLREKEC